MVLGRQQWTVQEQWQDRVGTTEMVVHTQLERTLEKVALKLGLKGRVEFDQQGNK